MSTAPTRSGEPSRTGAAARLATATEDAEVVARNSAAVRNYMLVGFAGLLSMVPILLLKGLDLWCIFPLLLGALSLMAHWRAGPIFVLLTLVSILVLRAYGYDPMTALETIFVWLSESSPLRGAGLSVVPVTPFLDLLLSACVLTYVAAHYRMQALVHNVIPLDARTPRPTNERVRGQVEVRSINPRRLPGLVTRWEVPLLVAGVLASAVAGDYLWSYVRGMRPRLDMSRSGWQALTVVWGVALLLTAAWTVFGYVGRTRMTREESLLYLQDQLWRQTRRE